MGCGYLVAGGVWPWPGFHLCKEGDEFVSDEPNWWFAKNHGGKCGNVGNNSINTISFRCLALVKRSQSLFSSWEIVGRNGASPGGVTHYVQKIESGQFEPHTWELWICGQSKRATPLREASCLNFAMTDSADGLRSMP